eukprot:COSAG02_NODE_1378_length_12990_cov_3.643705_2_plen_64_part_00
MLSIVVGVLRVNTRSARVPDTTTCNRAVERAQAVVRRSSPVADVATYGLPTVNCSVIMVLAVS